MNKIFIPLILLCSCNMEENILPECEHITIENKVETNPGKYKISIKIDSRNEFESLLVIYYVDYRKDEQIITIPRNYYECIRITVWEDTEVYSLDEKGNKLCKLY